MAHCNICYKKWDYISIFFSEERERGRCFFVDVIVSFASMDLAQAVTLGDPVCDIFHSANHDVYLITWRTEIPLLHCTQHNYTEWVYFLKDYSFPSRQRFWCIYPSLCNTDFTDINIIIHYTNRERVSVYFCGMISFPNYTRLLNDLSIGVVYSQAAGFTG